MTAPSPKLAGFALQQAQRAAGPPADATIADRTEDMRAGRPSRLADRQVNMLLDRSAPGISERLHFDGESGLLLRRIISTGRVPGNLVEQIDYDDYRAVGNLMLPYTITHTTWDAVDTFRVTGHRGQRTARRRDLRTAATLTRSRNQTSTARPNRRPPATAGATSQKSQPIARATCSAPPPGGAAPASHDARSPGPARSTVRR